MKNTASLDSLEASPVDRFCAEPTPASHSEWVAKVFDASHQKLINYATSLFSGDRDSAIDAVQETFLRLCKQERSNIESYIEPWLFRTCRNYIFDQLRQSNRMSTSNETTSIADRRVDVDPSARITQNDELQRCCNAIAKLPSTQQEILQLRMTHGMSYKQIAEVTGMTVTHVGVTLHQAIHKLRATLAT